MAKKKRASKSPNLKKTLLPVLSAVMCAAALSALSIVILAVLLRFGIVKEGIIPFFNQTVKVISISVAAFLSVRKPSENPWFRGMFAGLMYMLLAVLVFSIITQSFSFELSILLDVVMSAVIGAIVGAVFAKKA